VAIHIGELSSEVVLEEDAAGAGADDSASVAGPSTHESAGRWECLQDRRRTAAENYDD
jgi:hypothetical protein